MVASEESPDDLRYTETHGDPEDDSVILLPGAGMTRRVWRPHARKLVEEEYYVVAADKPAHGRNPVEDFSISAAVEQIAGMAQGLNNPVVAGHSAGGYIALRAGSQVSEITQVVSFSGGHQLASFPQGWTMSVIGELQQPVLSILQRTPVISERLENQEAELLDSEQYTDAPEENDGGVGDVMPYLTFSDTWPDDVSVPTLVAYGESEPLLGSPREMCEKHPNAEFSTFEGGHATPISDPDVAVPILLDFVSE